MTVDQRGPLPHFPDAPQVYDPANERQFRAEVERAIQQATQFIQGSRVASPAALSSGNNNNYSIGDTVTSLRLTPNAGGSTITGITNGFPGRKLTLINLGSAAITLAHQSGSSTAANRLISPSNASVTMPSNDVALLEYDGTTERWRIQRTVEPFLTNVTLAVFDNGSGLDDDYTVTWDVSAAVTDAANDVKVTVSREGVQADTGTQTSPVTTKTMSLTGTGEGTGTSNTHQAIVNLLDSSGNVIDSKSIEEISTT